MDRNRNERLANYDFMRVMMSLFVIGAHTPFPGYISNSKLLDNLLFAFLAQCNGVFFMISGKFNLCKSFDCKKDYIRYYVNKFISILVPYGIVSCILVLLELILSKQYFNLNGYIYQCIEAFFSTNARTHLWFVSFLIGILVSAPFLAKMVTAMKDEELKILFTVGIVWNIISIYLTLDLGFDFLISGWFLWEWLFIFFLGYFCDRIINDKNEKKIYCLGIIGFILSVLGMTYLKTFQYATDLSVGYIFFIMSCYLFLQRHLFDKKHLSPSLTKAVSYMAKYSFTAYMIHSFIIIHITSKWIDSNEGMIQYILLVLVSFACSYIISILLSNIIIKPIQKILSKVLKGLM